MITSSQTRCHVNREAYTRLFGTTTRSFLTCDVLLISPLAFGVGELRSAALSESAVHTGNYLFQLRYLP
jgi:hypothetical protein